jgi:O-antigen/teichoic acid export membrane protein
MIEWARTVRNAGLLMGQRGLHVVAGLFLVTLLPRMMGPETYGRYALITSISTWFGLIGGLGAVPVMSRFVPDIVARGDHEGLRRLVGHLLVFRLATGVLAAVLYFAFTSLWLTQVDRLGLLFVAASLWIGTGGNVLFALFLGLNDSARWGIGELLRRCVSAVLLVVGFRLGGLRGACLGLLATEIVVLGAGAWWARAYLTRSALRLNRRYLAPFLRFGALFFAGSVLLTLGERTGEAMVRLAGGDYRQVGYYGLANAAYLLGAHAFRQCATAFAPWLRTLRERGEVATMQRVIERLATWLAIAGMLAVLGVVVLGDHLLPLVLGAAYRPVAGYLLPLALALVTGALNSVGRVLALVHDRPGVALHAAVLQSVSFWVVGVPLVAWAGGLGGCHAVLVASALAGGYLTWRTRADVPYSLYGWVAAIGLGGGLLLLTPLRGSSWPASAVLYAGLVAGYGALLWGTRVVGAQDLVALRAALRPGRPGLEPAA